MPCLLGRLIRTDESTTLVVQVDPNTLEQLRAEARDEGVPIGDLIRAAIDDYLGKREAGQL